jgi:hypothetical protein
MKVGSLMMLVVLGAACSSAPPPSRAPSNIDTSALQQLLMERTDLPVYALIGLRQDLGLTSEQVVALDSIGLQLQQRNTPIARRLPAPGARPERGQQVDTVALRQLRENRRAAAVEVQQVLSEEQQTRVCEIYRQREVQARGGAARPAPRQQTGRGGVTITRPPVWPWCVAAAVG